MTGLEPVGSGGGHGVVAVAVAVAVAVMGVVAVAASLHCGLIDGVVDPDESFEVLSYDRCVECHCSVSRSCNCDTTDLCKSIIQLQSQPV